MLRGGHYSTGHFMGLVTCAPMLHCRLYPSHRLHSHSTGVEEGRFTRQCFYEFSTAAARII